MRKKKIIVYIVVGIIISLAFPLFIEWFLFSNNYFSLNNGMGFTREIWFGFSGSYLGAIGTVILGTIALFQNKRYKELSDKTEEKLIDLQREIKELNKKNVELIEISTKIERAKYHPTFLEYYIYYWTSIGQNMEESFFEDYVFQITGHVDNIDHELPVRKIFDNYNTFIFLLQNNGEKAIRNFNCNKVLSYELQTIAKRTINYLMYKWSNIFLIIILHPKNRSIISFFRVCYLSSINL